MEVCYGNLGVNLNDRSFCSAHCDINPNRLELDFNESDNTHLALSRIKAKAARPIRGEM